MMNMSRLGVVMSQSNGVHDRNGLRGRETSIKYAIPLAWLLFEADSVKNALCVNINLLEHVFQLLVDNGFARVIGPAAVKPVIPRFQPGNQDIDAQFKHFYTIV
jgi:hypothetical protein